MCNAVSSSCYCGAQMTHFCPAQLSYVIVLEPRIALKGSVALLGIVLKSSNVSSHQLN